MPVAEALAIHPSLHLEEEDPQRDRQALEELAHWAERYSPIVGLEEGEKPECLLLDVAGCATFFRGEVNLVRRAHEELRRAGWYARVAMAGTVGAAWALAHYADTPCLIESAETEAALRPLPLAALRLAGETLELLSKLGIERLEQLLALPRSGLSDRLGALVLWRLDQALGRLPEVVTPHRFLPEIHAFYALPYGTDRVALLKKLLDLLIERLHRLLQERGLGVRRLEWRLYHEQAGPRSVEVGLVRPSRAPDYLRLLLHAQAENLRLAEPVCAMALNALGTEPLLDNQIELFDSSCFQEELSAFIDQLNNRLGRGAVTRPMLVADPQPEFACRWEPLTSIPLVQSAGEAKPRAAKGNRSPSRSPSRSRLSPTIPFHAILPPRPLRLMSRPVPVQAFAVAPEGPPYQFHWAGKDHRILRAWGPERIETGWWRDLDVQRDYYRVETRSGTRYWLFRRRDDGRWFLHGCFE